MKEIAGSLQKINKINKPLARIIKEKKENAQITDIRNERESINTDLMDIKRTIKEYYEQLSAHI